MRRKRKRSGYYLEILHSTPQGEPRRTLMIWESPKRSRKQLQDFVLRLESHFAFIRPDVGRSIGYTIKPDAVNLRNCSTERVVASWRRAA